MQRRAGEKGRHEKWDSLIGVGAACLAVLAPLLIGGAHPTTQVALSAALMLIAIAYGLTRGRRGIRVVPFAALFAVFIALDLAQLLPLPAALVRVLSPGAYEIRSAVSARSWMPLSLDVTATVLAASRAFACLGLLLIIGGVCRTRRVPTRVLTVLAIFGSIEALIAIAQRAFNATAIFGVYVPRSMPGMGVFGTLVSSNHTASVLSIGALCATGLALDARGVRRALFIACAVLAAIVAVATGSRGGVLGLAAGGFVGVAVVLVRARGRFQGVVMATSMLALFAAGVLWSSDGLRARMLPSSSSQLVENQKTHGWVDGLRMAVDYRWTGVGRGAFEAPLRAYRADDEAVRLVYPENFVVQAAAEWGLPATLALLLMAALALRNCLRHDDVLEPPLIGALAAVVAVFVHELMDFGTELLGVALPATVALAVVAFVAGRGEERTRRIMPSLWAPAAAAWAALLLLAALSSGHTLDGDDVAMHDAVVARRATAPQLAAAIARHPADDYLELLAAEEALQRRDPTAMHHVNRALLLHPASWQGHQLAAHLLVALGHRSQAAIEFGLAQQHGLSVDDRQLVAMLGDDVVEAVPQRPAMLMALAERMVAIGRVAEAKKAWARALELSDEREPVLAAEVRSAGRLHDRALVGQLAAALLREATSPSSFLAAAQGFADAGAPDKAFEVIDRGLRAHADHPLLVLGGAQLELAAGKPQAAKTLLTAHDQGEFTLEQRRDAQQLLASIAELSGDVEGGVIARARAQLLERQIRAITSGTSHPGLK